MSVSIWWLMLALIPLAVLLLAVSSMLPHQGALHNTYERVVRLILFSPVPGAPQLSFIKFLLVGLGIVASMCGLQVYNDSTRVNPSLQAGSLDKQLLAQGKGFRNQRNLYLTCLALALWWSVYVVFTLKAHIARLLDQKDAAAARNNAVAPPKSVASATASSSSSSATESAAAVRRNLPKPSAPELSPEPNTNEKHLE